MNREHIFNFEAVYEILRDLAFKQNRQVESDRKYKLYNYDTLYGRKTFNLTDGRALTVKIIRLPLFSHQNKPRYYTVFLCNSEWWEIGNIPSIDGLCKNILRKQDSDGYTIFLCGLQKGFLLKKHNWIAKKHNTVLINSRKRHVDEVRANIFKIISKYLKERCIGLFKSIDNKIYVPSVEPGAWKTTYGVSRRMHIYGQLKLDWQRVNTFARSLYALMRQFWKIRMKKRDLKKEIDTKKEPLTISSNNSNNGRRERRERAINRFISQLSRQEMIVPS